MNPKLCVHGLDRPLVTVLFPSYNAEAFLRPALDSVLGQTYSHLEVLAIDDGSTDATAAILADYAVRDSRVRLAPNPENRGLIDTLNRGVALAGGSLIARMDADDVAMPERIEEQVRYFTTHPETGLLSSDYSYIGMNGGLRSNPQPYRFSDAVLRFLMFFVNPICHSTVMGRRDVFRKHAYSGQAKHVEDFELWSRMLSEGVTVRNLPERLLRFRSTSGGVSSRHEPEQIAMFVKTSARAIDAYFGLKVDLDVHRILVNRMPHGMVSRAALKAALRLFRDMKREYRRREQLGRADTALVEDFADRHLANIFLHSFKRSSREHSARGLAAREALLMTCRNPRPICHLALSRTRERISR